MDFARNFQKSLVSWFSDDDWYFLHANWMEMCASCNVIEVWLSLKRIGGRCAKICSRCTGVECGRFPLYCKIGWAGRAWLLPRVAWFKSHVIDLLFFEERLEKNSKVSSTNAGTLQSAIRKCGCCITQKRKSERYFQSMKIQSGRKNHRSAWSQWTNAVQKIENMVWRKCTFFSGILFVCGCGVYSYRSCRHLKTMPFFVWWPVVWSTPFAAVHMIIEKLTDNSLLIAEKQCRRNVGRNNHKSSKWSMLWTPMK